MNSKGLLLFIMIFLSSFFFVLGSDDWFLVWLGLEINMFSFMVIISKNNCMEIESCLKYFFIQSLGSGMLMLSFYSQVYVMNFINGLVLSYKMGAGPFYFWFPSLCEGISWMSCYLLMTIQKIIPLVLMSTLGCEVMWMVIITSLIIGALGSFNQISLKRLMAYSSIHHMGWLMICLMISISGWVIYLAMYMFMMYGVFVVFMKNDMLMMNFMMKFNEKWMIILGMLSMGGVPPMLGFFLKWWIFFMMQDIIYFYYMFMLIVSVLMIYIYMRIIYILLLGENMVMKTNLFFYEVGKISFMDSVYIMGMMMGSFLGMFFIIL